MDHIKIDIQRSAERMQNKIDQMFEHLLKQAKSFSLLADNVWRPPLDVYETSEAVIMLMEIAGVKRDDFTIILDRNYLIIRGHRRDFSDQPKIRLHQMEIDYGVFERVVQLSISYDENGITASYNDGFLKITVPKKKEQIQGRIDISS